MAAEHQTHDLKRQDWATICWRYYTSKYCMFHLGQETQAAPAFLHVTEKDSEVCDANLPHMCFAVEHCLCHNCELCRIHCECPAEDSTQILLQL